MLKLYIMCGLAFSGKSTLARKIAQHTKSKLIAFDKLWVEKNKEHPISKNAEGWKYIRNVAQKEILASLKSGTSVVYDENNSKKDHRDELRNTATRAGADAIVIYLDTPVGVIKVREEANTTSRQRHDVESENFQKVMKDMEVPTADENALIFTPETDEEKFLNKLGH